MPGFKVDGSLGSFGSMGSVSFQIKSSTGREVRSVSIPSEKADDYESKWVAEEEPKIRAEVGESEPLHLIRISRC